MSNNETIIINGCKLSEFVDFNERLGIVFQKGGDEFSCSYKFTHPAILFSRCHSIFSLQIENKEPFTIDAYSTIAIPSKVSFKIISQSSICELAILLPDQKLIREVCTQYTINKEDVAQLFDSVHKLPRANWFNELMHRYVYERAVAKNQNNAACIFLEVEIIKELYFLFKEQNIAIKNRFNLDALNLDKKSDITRKLMIYIESNLFNEISSDDLTKHIGASESTIQRSFTKDVGISPFKYIKERKLEEAFILLKSQSFSVNEVAHKIGYEDVSAFISSFKKKFSYTPSKLLD